MTSWLRAHPVVATSAGLLLWAGAAFVLVWQGEWRSLRGSSPVAIPLRFEEVHVEQRPWRLSEAAPPAAPRTPFAAVYGRNVVRQDFRSPADRLNQLSLWMAGPEGEPVVVVLRDRASGAQYVAKSSIVDPSGRVVRFRFPAIDEAKGKDLELTIAAPQATAERAIVLRAAPGDRVGGLAHLNVYPVTANLDFAVYHRGLPGRWWLDALAERLLPAAFRSRVQQYKPGWVQEGALSGLIAVGLVLAALAVSLGLRRRTDVRWALPVAALGILGLCALGVGERLLGGAATEMLPAEDGPAIPSLASGPHVAFDMLMSLDGATWDRTRTRDRGQAWAEMPAWANGPQPGLVVADGYSLAWRLRVPAGAAFRATVAPRGDVAWFEVWVTADGARTCVFRRLVPAQKEGGRGIEADLGAFAGQQVRIELRCLAGEGFWAQPHVVTCGDWLRPFPLPPAQGPPIAASARFGEGIELLGYALDAVGARPGGELSLDLYWHAVRRTDEDYTVFVHLVDGTGAYVAGQDAWPVHDAFSTRLWAPGFAVVDEHTLRLPEALPAGTYRLGMGLYRLETMVRLPAVGVDGVRLPDDVLWVDQRLVIP